MNKYQLEQRLYWIKYHDDMPELRSFVVCAIKQDKTGYKYSSSGPAASYIRERVVFETIEGAVYYGCALLEKLLDEEKEVDLNVTEIE